MKASYSGDEHPMSKLRFADRVAVITGAGRGLGRAYALLLASRDAKVVVNDVDTHPAEEVVREIRAAGGAAVAGLIGLSNAVALEGAEEGVKCNLIIPAAVTRLSEGIDTSAFPPMPPELVAPVVGWLVHESCSVTGEMLISAAGRVAKAFVAETRGVYRLAPVPSGFMEHLGRSFEMARKGSAT